MNDLQKHLYVIKCLGRFFTLKATFSLFQKTLGRHHHIEVVPIVARSELNLAMLVSTNVEKEWLVIVDVFAVQVFLYQSGDVAD